MITAHQLLTNISSLTHSTSDLRIKSLIQDAFDERDKEADELLNEARECVLNSDTFKEQVDEYFKRRKKGDTND